MPRLALYLLGPPRLELDGEEVHIPRRKAVALLAYLAVTGRSHSRNSLATLLWPELDQSIARARLRRVLAALKEAIGAGWLEADRETVGLDPDADLWLDVDAFHERLAACETHIHPPTEACPDCVPLLEEAVALYQDHFLAGFTLRDSAAFDEWQFFETEGLKDELAGTLVRLVTYQTSQGDFEGAIGHARRWLALDPLHEPAHRHLMVLYAQSGQQSAALRQYRLCLRTLEEELDLPPSAETTALYERIRAERARPIAAEATVPIPSSPDAALPVFLAEEEALSAAERPVFVAREEELARLDGYLKAALAGQGQIVFITGGPGRGKTALMHEFARRAMEAHPDLLVATGNCNAYSGVGDPYLPFREALGMLSGDVEGRWAAGTVSRDHARHLWAALPLALRALVDHGPSLIGTIVPGAGLLSRAAAVAPQDAAWLAELRGLAGRERPGHTGLEQSAIFQQVTNVLRGLARERPLLLLLDDVQWADAGSIGLLFHLGRRLEGGRILIACAYRPEEVALERDGERHPLEQVLAEFRRGFGDVWVDLAQADAAQGRSFVDALLATEPHRLGKDFRDRLFQRTGGHPLFTVELLRTMQERGDLVKDETGQWIEGPTLDWERLPARVEAVIAARVGRLGEEHRDLLAVASVEGERFTAQVAAQVQGLSEREVLRALAWELGTRHRLVREGEEVQVDGRFLSRYQFTHALFQEHLYRGLSAGERRLLHGEVAMVLEALYGDQADQIAAQLAHHFDEAGQAEKAIHYALRAGDQARLAYANEEAIAYLHRALERLDGSPLGESRKDWRVEALGGLGQIYFGMGKIAEAEEPLRQAIALGREIGLATRGLVRLHYWLGDVLWWQSSSGDDVIRVGEEGLALLGDDTESVEVALMNCLIAAGYRNKEEGETFRDFAYRTAQFIQRLPYVEELRPAYVLIHIAHSEDKDAQEAMRWLHVLKERATQHRDLRAVAGVHHYMGLTLRNIGDLRGAVSRHGQSLRLRTRIGDIKHAAVSLFCLGNTFLWLGDLQKAEEHSDTALESSKLAGIKRNIECSYGNIGLIALCWRDWGKAVDAFVKQLPIVREMDNRWGEALTLYRLGQAYLAQGDREEALRQSQEAVAVAGSWLLSAEPLEFSFILSGLEETYGDPEVFRAFCHRFREEHPQARDSPLVQWFLEPAAVGAIREPPLLHRSEFTTSLSPDWTWQDPFDDCSFSVQNGLEIHAANSRDLYHINLSAPRLLRSVRADFVAQTVCVPGSKEKPTIGGLLLWKDRQNYLRLNRGYAGKRDILFGGCLANQDVIIGRGRLPAAASERVYLRLERSGERVDAFCSADGEAWFTAGHTEFPVEDSIQVGLYAIGNIDRGVYHGAYPDGTAIRFESFQLWGLNH